MEKSGLGQSRSLQKENVLLTQNVYFWMREPPQLKHLSKVRKRKQCDCASSGERKRNSLNPNLLRKEFDGGLRDFNVRPVLIAEWSGMANQRE